MIVEAKQIDKNGTMAYRSFAFGLTTKAKRHRGFPSLSRDLATLRMSQDRPGDVRSDYLKPDTSAIPDNVDGDSLFCGADSPQPDVFCGPKKLVSLRQLSLHSGAEPGLCEHALRQGWVSPDEKPGGNPCWNFGKSAMKASMKLGLIKDAAK